MVSWGSPGPSRSVTTSSRATTDGPAEITRAIAGEIGRETRYRPVDEGGARRAAELIAELL